MDPAGGSGWPVEEPSGRRRLLQVRAGKRWRARRRCFGGPTRAVTHLPRARRVPEVVTPAYPAVRATAIPRPQSVMWGSPAGAKAAVGVRDRCRPPRMAGRARPPAGLCRGQVCVLLSIPPSAGCGEGRGREGK